MKYNGTINIRQTNGKKYYSYQYLKDGKQVSKAVTEFDAYHLGFKIHYPGNDVDEFLEHSFHHSVSFGATLLLLTKSYLTYKRRYCFDKLKSFLTEDQYYGKVLVLYGLRRTGKTTLIFQSIGDLSFKEFNKTAYIKIDKSKNFYDLLDDLKYLTSNGFKYIYIDEVTLLDDFISLSSTLSDIYGLMAKIVLSGTDSLGFKIASYHELFDRSVRIHTTYIPFKEFSDILGVNSIDQYIEYGGTMSKEGIDYNRVISSYKGQINEYTDSAIAHNIVHSLKVCEDGKYFAHLYPLYEKGELENVINRIVEDHNHRFAISIIERDFKSHDFGSLKQLVVKKNNATELGHVLDQVDEQQLTKDLMDALSIINKDRQTIKVSEEVLKETENFLDELDVSKEISQIDLSTFLEEKRKVFTQPGLRYSQAKKLVELLLNEPSIIKYPQPIIDLLKEKLLSDVKGRMIEDMILLEKSEEHSQSGTVFKVRFGIRGEYDMVILDRDNYKATIFEIKYSHAQDPSQYKYLVDQELSGKFTDRYFPIEERVVLYRGESQTLSNGVKYLNIEEFLKR